MCNHRNSAGTVKNGQFEQSASLELKCLETKEIAKSSKVAITELAIELSSPKAIPYKLFTQ